MVVRWLALSLLLLVKCGAPLYAQTPTFPPKLLAYGDSLTAGFWAGGHHFHPYSTKLSECVRTLCKTALWLTLEQAGSWAAARWTTSG